MPLPRGLIETILISTLFQIITALIITEHLINGVNSFKTFKLKSSVFVKRCLWVMFHQTDGLKNVQSLLFQDLIELYYFF